MGSINNETKGNVFSVLELIGEFDLIDAAILVSGNDDRFSSINLAVFKLHCTHVIGDSSSCLPRHVGI